MAAQVTGRAQVNARVRAAYAADPDKFRKRNRAKYHANPEPDKARATAARKRDPVKTKIYSRRSTLKRRYGITEAEYFAMLKGQKNRCACCGKKFTKKRIPAIDHCHETGKVRGVLCRNCNSGIALLGDQTAGLNLAKAYLEGWSQWLRK